MLANLRPGNYELIIDIDIPKVSGFDLYRGLKKRDRGSIKVCSMTAFEIYYEEFRKM